MLFGTTKLLFSTIRSYRTAVSYLFGQELQDILNSKNVKIMLSGFTKSQPSIPRLPPAIWNVDVVLFHLAKYPSAHKLDNRLLCKKTLTLLLLATTRHRADILAISVANGCIVEDKERVVCKLQRLSKTYSTECKWVQNLEIRKYQHQHPDFCPVLHLFYYIAVSTY